MDAQPEDSPIAGGHRAPVDGLLLEVRDLHLEFRTDEGTARAINGVDLDLSEGETLAILGESGSGKSVTAQAIMGILDMPPARIPQGTIKYRGEDLLTMHKKRRRAMRGPEISMIFQDALASLNPVFPIGWQIAEMFRIAPRHRTGRDALAASGQADANASQIPDAPAARQGLSRTSSPGGMRQRVMIAMALALRPRRC